MKVLSCVFFTVVLLISFPLHSEKNKGYEIIKDLSPTHGETKKFTPLKIETVIPFDFNEKDFLATPTSVISDDRGNIFVYDARQVRVYAFSPSGKPLFRFSRRGEGPGEMAAAMGRGGGYDKRKISFSKNLGILVNGFRNQWINVFDPKNGKFKHVIKIPSSKLFLSPGRPKTKYIYHLSFGKRYTGVGQKRETGI